jgi:integrase/recombinase XerD
MNEVHHFKSYLKSRAYAKRTITDYEYYVLKFVRHIEFKSILEVTEQDIRSYHYSLIEDENKKLGPVSIRQHLGALKAFYKYLQSVGNIYLNPLENYKLPVKPKRLPRNILTPEEILKLLEAPNEKTAIGLRDKTIIELMYSTGIRNSELRSIKLSDLDLKGGSLWLIGKGDKEAVLPIGSYALKYLEAYIKRSRNDLLKGKRGGPRTNNQKAEDLLFVSSNGYKLNGGNLSSLLNKYATKAGLKKVNPHSIRHSCATHLLKNGADIRYIQRLLRHASLDTTQIYTKVEITDLREVQKKYHPREKDEDAD